MGLGAIGSGFQVCQVVSIGFRRVQDGLELGSEAVSGGLRKLSIIFRGCFSRFFYRIKVFQDVSDRFRWLSMEFNRGFQRCLKAFQGVSVDSTRFKNVPKTRRKPLSRLETSFFRGVTF